MINTARECTQRLPFRPFNFQDSSLIKSILYKNGRGLNPETIVEKVATTTRECTLRLPVLDSLSFKSIPYKNGRGLNPETIVKKVRDKHGRYLTHPDYLSVRIRRVFKPNLNDGRNSNSVDALDSKRCNNIIRLSFLLTLLFYISLAAIMPKSYIVSKPPP